MVVKIKGELIGLQPYKPGKPIEELKRDMGLKDVIKLASNENSFNSSPKAVEAIKRVVYEINRYPDGGCFYLRQRLAKKFGIKEENLIIGNGSDEIIILSIKALLEKNDEVVIADPTFLIYRLASQIAGLKMKLIPLKNMKYDLEAMAKAVSSKTRLIFIANPDNPTGSYVSKGEVESFMEEISEDIILFFDEAYFEYAEGDDYPDTLIYHKRGNIITTRTFSKIYGLAGLRIGYGISDEEITALLNKVREPFNVNSLAQEAALAALDDDEFVKEVRELTDQGKQQLYDGLDRMNVCYIPSATNFILIELGPRAGEIYNKLLKRGIIVRYMFSWGLKDYIRVTIGKSSENERFLKALADILTSTRV